MIAAVNDKAPLFSISHVHLLRASTDSPQSSATRQSQNALAQSLLAANMNTIPFDWAARMSIGGTDMGHFIIKQLPVLPPQEYLRWHLPGSLTYVELIMPRVLELIFTAYDLEPFARDLGYGGPPFEWSAERRLMLKSELDAIYAHMYGLERTEIEWMLDPAPPSVSFPTLKRNELEEFGEFRTKRLILEAFDQLA